jgi:thioredoxin 1
MWGRHRMPFPVDESTSEQVSDYGGMLTGMAITELTADTLDLATAGNGVLLIEWQARDNDHGQLIAPVFEAASRRHPDVRFAIVDARAHPQLSADAGIVSLPTLMAVRDGVRVFAMPGAP